jgi:hypothetical protein
MQELKLLRGRYNFNMLTSIRTEPSVYHDF